MIPTEIVIPSWSDFQERKEFTITRQHLNAKLEVKVFVIKTDEDNKKWLTTMFPNEVFADYVLAVDVYVTNTDTNKTSPALFVYKYDASGYKTATTDTIPFYMSTVPAILDVTGGTR